MYLRTTVGADTLCMRKLILQEWISVDGYAADKNNRLDFLPSTESSKYSDIDQLQFMETIDTILLGRITYNLFVDFWPGATTETEIIADKLNCTPKMVFSNTLKKAPCGQWTDAQIVTGNAAEKVKKLKAAGGKNMVMWGSLSLAQSLMKENLIDEYHIQVCPTILGGGRALFPNTAVSKSVTLVQSKKYNNGLMFLHYEPVLP